MNSEKRIKDNFERQKFMKTLGAQIISVQDGEVRIGCDYRDVLTQQNGYLHAGVLTSVVDSACGYAALSVMPEDADVLSVEFKMNLLRPADTTRIIAIGKVLKAGRKIVVCEGSVFDATGEKLLCRMTATMFCNTKKPD